VESLLRPLHSIVWNLFLAIIPVVLALVVYFGVSRDQKNGRIRWIVWTPFLAAWLAFLPNACYLVTEWRHYIDELVRHPELFFMAKHHANYLTAFILLTAFYIMYTGSGLVCFYLSIYPLDVLFRPLWFIRPIFFFLCSLGVYLGLVDRFNSWQIVSHPHLIIHAAHSAIEKPLLLILLIGFSLILWLFYGVFGLTMDGARLKYRLVRPTA
jgi:uncharacterized membrane protein